MLKIEFNKCGFVPTIKTSDDINDFEILFGKN